MVFNKKFSPDPEQIRSACKKPLHKDAEDGINLFNRGLYFQAHESLEDAWHQESDPDRRLYQGILQAGLVFMHAKRKNYKGIFTMYARCSVWLGPWPDNCRTIYVGKLKKDVEKLVTEAERLGKENLGQLNENLFTKIERAAE